MKTTFTLRQGLFLTSLGLLGALATNAQTLNFPVNAAAVTTRTFSSLSTSSSTAIVVTDEDDDNSAPQNIGFTFNYNGQSFTQFTLNTNGVMKLGANPLSGDLDDFMSSTDPADVNVLAPLLNDLIGSSAATGFRYATTGTAPNRVCTVQWTDMTEFDTPAQFSGFTFQVKLYETTNAIEFVYGPLTAGSTPASSFSLVGLKGAGIGTGQLLLATKADTAPWNTATFQNTLYTAQAFEYTQATLPTAGQTFRFTPTTTAVQDAQLTRAIELYPNPSLGSVALDVRAAGPDLQVEVSNVLGQRVYTTSARANHLNQLDLSALSNGLYTVRLSQGQAYTVRKLQIQK